jgi:hypothetical protein
MCCTIEVKSERTRRECGRNVKRNINPKSHPGGSLKRSTQYIKTLRIGIKTIQDIINLQSVEHFVRHHPSLGQLVRIIEPLKHLQDMVGLQEVKRDIFRDILLAVQSSLQTSAPNDCNTFKQPLTIPHIVIYGPPGIGKSQLGGVLGDIYAKLGILKTGKCVVAKRSDLIAGYLGQTSIKTQSKIDEAEGGVLFLDEAYALGAGSKYPGDSYAKECVDCINRNLTERMGRFLCIVAGYETELKECFFNQNPGLERRFPIRYCIKPYDSLEMAQILELKCKYDGIYLKATTESIATMIGENTRSFTGFGGDIINWLFFIKREIACKSFYNEIPLSDVVCNNVLLNESLTSFNKSKDWARRNINSPNHLKFP